MDKTQLEQKVYGLINRVKNGSRVEDTTIELKTTWPNGEHEAARQLAGQANAARGEPILWIIGVDEKQRKVVPAEPRELANWLPAVASHFDEMFYPKLVLHLPVHVDGEVVIALCFETDRAPYVVKNPSFGKQNGGPVKYEVPWREGNATRSAVRADLLRVLLKAIKRPSVEVRKATMTFSRHVEGQEKWLLQAELYAVPQDGSPVVFPSHQWSGDFLHVYTGQELELNIMPINIAETSSGSATLDQVRCVGPMGFKMIGERTIPSITQSFPDEIDARIQLGIAGEDNLPVVLNLKMGNMRQQDNGTIIWEQGDWKRPQRKIAVGVS